MIRMPEAKALVEEMEQALPWLKQEELRDFEQGLEPRIKALYHTKK